MSMDREDRIMLSIIPTVILLLLGGIHANLILDPDTGLTEIAGLWIGIVTSLLVVAGTWAGVYRFITGYELAKKRANRAA